MTSTPAPSILQIVYVSSAAVAFDDAGLESLLAASRLANERAGITGMLLHKDGNFLQLIEGDPAAVRALHARILRDRRHHHVITVFENLVAERQFPEWTMGYVPADRLPPPAARAFSSFLLAGGDAARFEPTRGDVREALATFRRNVR